MPKSVTEPVPLEPDPQRYRLHGVERALDTLELLAAVGPGGMTLTELAERILVRDLELSAARGYTIALGGPRSRPASAAGPGEVVARPVYTGICGTDLELLAVNNDLLISASFASTSAAFAEVAAGQISPAALVTHRFPLDAYDQAYQVLRVGPKNSGPRGKVMLEVDAP